MRVFEARIARVEVGMNNVQAVAATAEQATAPSGNAPITIEDLESIKRLPDCVRDIQVFEGNPTQYVSWIANVESILKDYQVVSDKPIYSAILKHIRQKIRGPADSALVSYNIFNDTWANIKKCLSLHYADKRDIQSLENQLTHMKQGRDSIDHFFNRINYQLSLIINKIKTDDYNEDGMKVLIENYRHRALDVFIRGLQQNLAHLIKAQKPRNLPEAYTACLELQNMDYRKSMANNTHGYNSFSKIAGPAPEYPQFTHEYKQQHDRPPRNFLQSKPFIPAKPPTRPNENNFAPPRPLQDNYTPPRPTQPKPPVPMEVDPSIQTARVNYMNRVGPNVKRSNESSNVPRKSQRVFNIETSEALEAEDTTTEEEEKEEEEYLEHFNEEFQEVNFMTAASPEYRT